MDLRHIQAGGGGPLGAFARGGLTFLEAGWAAGSALAKTAARLGFPRQRRLPVRVVSVGNLTAGGTGKTPFVAWLAGRALAAGRRPGILARGYGPRPRGSTLSDEGTLLADLLGPAVPQWEDPDRFRGGERLLAVNARVDLVILDDGFQHRRLARDADVVLLDATNPFGYGRLLPRGLLREQASGLERADAVVLTRTERVDPSAVARLRAEATRLAPRAGIALSRMRPRALVAVDGSESPAEGLRGRRVYAYAAIGNPAAFEGTLRDLGASILGSRIEPDHHMPSADEAADVGAAARAAGADVVVTTRKDLVKWRTLPGRPAGLLAVDIALEVVEGEAALLSRVLSGS